MIYYDNYLKMPLSELITNRICRLFAAANDIITDSIRSFLFITTLVVNF